MNEAGKDLVNSLLDSNPNEQLKALGILMLSVLEEVKKITTPQKAVEPEYPVYTGTMGSGMLYGTASCVITPTQSLLSGYTTNTAIQRMIPQGTYIYDANLDEVVTKQKPLFDRIFGT
jgi:hypothetical protein